MDESKQIRNAVAHQVFETFFSHELPFVNQVLRDETHAHTRVCLCVCVCVRVGYIDVVTHTHTYTNTNTHTQHV